MSGTKSESQASALLNTVNVLTFNVFGTLFDWESGVSKGLAGLYRRERSRASDELALQIPIGDESARTHGALMIYQVLIRKLVL
jgi:hypothetical protein